MSKKAMTEWVHTRDAYTPLKEDKDGQPLRYTASERDQIGEYLVDTVGIYVETHAELMGLEDTVTNIDASLDIIEAEIACYNWVGSMIVKGADF